MKSVAEEVLQEIVRRLVAEFDPEQIILFGSRAWGEPGPESDYDLFVILTDIEERHTEWEVRAHASLSGLGISKDVIVSSQARFDRFSRAPASLEAQILKKGVVLYGRGDARTRSQLASEGVA
jgi:predicted nucleotidyltransferase